MSTAAIGEPEVVRQRWWRLDWLLLAAVAGLLGFGLLMVTSASSLAADERYGDALHYVTRQVAGTVGGLAGIGLILWLPYKWLRKSVWPAYIGSLGLLCLVFTPLGVTAYAATRWISLGGVNLQPSEFGKIALILVLGHYLAANEGRLRDVLGVVFPAVLIPAPMLLLFMLQPDFGTTVLTVGLVCVALFIAGLRWLYVGGLGAIAGAGLAVLGILAPYRVRRLVSFTDPWADYDGAGYQVIQAWIAMASGGWTGQGLASGVAQRGALPEAHTDFISAVVGEELGAIGWLALVAFYVIVIWRGSTIAARAKDLFGTVVAACLTALLGGQAIINLGVVTGLLPAKGLVLPFVSYGASAVLAHLLVVGILLRISAESNPAVMKGVAR